MIFKPCIFLLTLFILPGCATLHLVSFGMSGISYITTGKSLSDHAISSVREEDCAVHRFLFEETICHKNSDLLETNSKTVLAKNTDQEDTQLSISSINMTEVNVDGITGKFRKNKQGLYKKQWDNVARYKVIGSFNNEPNAIAFANLYQEMGAMVIANEEAHTEKQLTKIYGAKYRVVLDPYLANTQTLEAENVTKAAKSAYWMLSLCTKTLSPPPCLDTSVILASTNIK